MSNHRSQPAQKVLTKPTELLSRKAVAAERLEVKPSSEIDEINALIERGALAFLFKVAHAGPNGAPGNVIGKIRSVGLYTFQLTLVASDGTEREPFTLYKQLIVGYSPIFEWKPPAEKR